MQKNTAMNSLFPIYHYSQFFSPFQNLADNNKNENDNNSNVFHYFDADENNNENESKNDKNANNSNASNTYDLEADWQNFLEEVSLYLNFEEIQKVKSAFELAKVAHAPQRRASGEPYISHPLAVAKTVAEWRLDCDAVCAALLHDVMEDTGTSKDELVAKFGQVIADLVDGLSKIDKLEFSSYKEAQAENFRKMLFAMAKDLRVILVKLSDRQHNLRTMSAMRPDKRRRIAFETQEVYAPIALRLGLMTVYREFKDICYRLIYPNRAKVLEKAMKHFRKEREELHKKIFNDIQTALQSFNRDNTISSSLNSLKNFKIKAEIKVREKGLFALIEQMKEKKISFSEVMDIQNFRILVENIPECYLVLGALHYLYKPKTNRFADYIALPKSNGYQSLHTELIGLYGTPISIHIRTEEMHKIAEEGIINIFNKTIRRDSEKLANKNKSYHWVKSLLDIQGNDSYEFYENVKTDLLAEDAYVFTPKGEIIAIKKGATAIDFAYAINNNVGNHAVTAVVNGKVSALNYVLNNGDIVEIQTENEASPKENWLNFAKTGRARSKIKHSLLLQQNESAIKLGKHLLEQELSNLGMVQENIPEFIWLELLKNYGHSDISEIYADIGNGICSAKVLVKQIIARDSLPISKNGKNGIENDLADSTLIISGNEGIAIQYANCCSPIPGDEIVGKIKKGVGLKIHCKDCLKIQKSLQTENNKWINVIWSPQNLKDIATDNNSPLFNVRLQIETDKIVGILAQLAKVMNENKANIEGAYMTAENNVDTTMKMLFTIQVKNRMHLANVLRKVRQLNGVQKIIRIKEDKEKFNNAE